MPPIDRYAWTNRWRRRHPAEKLLLAGGLLLLSLLLPPLPAAPLVLVVAVLATVLGAGIPATALLRFMAIPATFLLSSLPLLALSVSSSGIGYSPQGLETALQVMVRSLAALSCLALLTLTTPVVAWAPLLRRVGVPQVIVEIMLLLYRLIFVIAEEAVSGAQAQSARLGYDGLRRSLNSLGLLIANLLERSLARVRRLQIGLAARQFDGDLRVLPAEYDWSSRRMMFTGCLLLGIAAVGLLGGQ